MGTSYGLHTHNVLQQQKQIMETYNHFARRHASCVDTRLCWYRPDAADCTAPFTYFVPPEIAFFMTGLSLLFAGASCGLLRRVPESPGPRVFPQTLERRPCQDLL